MSQHATTLTQTSLPADHSWRKLPAVGIVLAVIGLGASTLFCMNGQKEQFYYSYMTSFMYWLSLGLGGLFFVLIHHATKAGWSVVIRRLAENVMGTLPWMALMAIPIIIGIQDHVLFHHWTDAEAVAKDTILQGKSGFLNVPFFYARMAFYFGVWFFLVRKFRGGSVAQDTSGDHEITRSLTRWSYPGIILFALTLSFAAIDWIMSHDPHWYSTMFGVYYFAGSVMGIFALMSVIVVRLRKTGMLVDVITVEHDHDLGKYCMAFVIFWTYIAFSQYMLIWYANLPEETIWFAHRLTGGWETITMTLVFGHFVVPLFFFLPSTIKRIPNLLFAGAVWLLFIHYVDIYYLIMPNLHHHLHISLMDASTFLGVGGVFLFAFGRLMGADAVIAHRDPRLPESLNFENFAS